MTNLKRFDPIQLYGFRLNVILNSGTGLQTDLDDAARLHIYKGCRHFYLNDTIHV